MLHENTRPSARSRPVPDEGSLRIHIGNIPFGWSEKHLREQFEVRHPIGDGAKSDVCLVDLRTSG